MESIQNSVTMDADTKRRKRAQKERERVQRVASYDMESIQNSLAVDNEGKEVKKKGEGPEGSRGVWDPLPKLAGIRCS